MGRKENPIVGTGPIVEFAESLRRVRQEAGSPRYRDMALRAHISAPALSLAAAGKKLPTWETTKAYLRACNVTDRDSVQRWRQAWERTRVDVTSSDKDYANGEEPQLAAPSTTNNEDESLGSISIDSRLRGVFTIADYVTVLDDLRRYLRYTIREIAEQSRIHPGGPLPKSTISDVLSGKRQRITPEFVKTYLYACGLKRTQVGTWLAYLQRILDTENRARAALDMLRMTELAEEPVGIINGRLRPNSRATPGTRYSRWRRVSSGSWVWVPLIVPVLVLVVWLAAHVQVTFRP
jgi:transcriptional regulator with XRE-family HTH domain